MSTSATRIILMFTSAGVIPIVISNSSIVISMSAGIISRCYEYECK